MDSISAIQQRNDIRKARKRDPIASVFMLNAPGTCYSISVPSSKSWHDFLQKLRKQFKLPSDCALSLYQAPADRTSIDLAHLHQYDTTNTDMSRIKHKCTFCVVQNDPSDDTHSTSSHSQSNSASASPSDSSDSEHKEEAQPVVDVNERSLGIDLDLLGRLPSKKVSKNKAIYHFHPPARLNALDFHLKSTWHTLRSQSMTVRHIDEKYSLLTDAQSPFTLRTRRLIWPVAQQQSDGFDFRPSDASTWTWAILLCHGGKFAGAIYRGDTMVLHKTLKRYVVRKKQGKRQVNHLSSGAKAGSAGGFKRSYNEAKLLSEIREVLGAWMQPLAHECDRIMVHAPGVYNEATLFGTAEEQSQLYPTLQGAGGRLNVALSKERLAEVASRNKHAKTKLYRLYKKDARIEQIPITTHGVTLKEVERVHYWMSTCWLSKT